MYFPKVYFATEGFPKVSFPKVSLQKLFFPKMYFYKVYSSEVYLSKVYLCEMSSKLCEFFWSFQVIFLHLWFPRTSYIVLVCISSLWAKFLQNCSSEFAKWSLELSQQSPYWLGGSYWGGRLRRKPLKVATPTIPPTQPVRRRYALVSN